MKKNLFVLFIILVVLAACTPPKESTDVWVNKEKIKGKSFNKLFIVVMTADPEARSTVENDLARVATSRGHPVVKSIDVITTNLRDPKMPTKDEVVAKVKETGCDAVFVATVLKKEEAVNFTPGSSAYATAPYPVYAGTYTGYYSYWYPSVSTPDYYDKEKTYFMRSNLYDVASEEIMWSVQSKIFSPESLKKFSKAYTSTLVKQLEKGKLIKKIK
jgi:hypothetical protein